ncbi:Panacea domain-containing protein [Aeromicrobium sp. HA]|uniref:Panacea domain-containing protein n=1 Tax=Aeromicrobium sp. HA TaxID=3009077 RepID=UPI0022B04AB5|nr:Panacea domain-containing protein [Aeromicrobium sp. HA]
MTATTAYNQTKFTELLLHVAERSSGDPRFGKTKLNKILFYIDFLAYKTKGNSVTGATYQRRPMGPVPMQIVQAKAALIAEGAATNETRDFMGYKQERLIAAREADLSVFSEAELQVIDSVIVGLWDHTGSSVSDISHGEPGWRLADEKDTIPYESVFIGDRELTGADIARGQQIWAELQLAPA